MPKKDKKNRSSGQGLAGDSQIKEDWWLEVNEGQAKTTIEEKPLNNRDKKRAQMSKNKS